MVDEGYQGIQRRVLTPGTYRLNPRAYRIELADAVVVPLGCCGVVTSQLGEMPGGEIVTEKIIGPARHARIDQERTSFGINADGAFGRDDS